MTIYNEYSRAKVGWVLGLSGVQAATLVAAAFPTLIAISKSEWITAFTLALVFVLVALIVVVPVRGRSATGWLAATTAFAIGLITGRTRYRSRAAKGQPSDLEKVDLPGALTGIEIHEGPPAGPAQTRLAIIQNHATRTWALTASVAHPGIRMADEATRDRFGAGLANLLEVCSRTELIDEVLFMVRSVPDDGAERRQWVESHRKVDGPQLAHRVNDEMHEVFTGAAVRTETFVTMVVSESRLAKEAKEAGGGLDGRARVLYLLAGEIEAGLRGAVGMADVVWLTSPELSAACRTGFAPGDRAGIVDALREAQGTPGVAADVPWAMAGPSGADPVVRHYSHDCWNSISATIKLPDKGAVMGALAPILVPTEPAERRSFVVAFPVLTQARAERQTRSSETGADIADALREKGKVKQRAREREQSKKVRGIDTKLAHGSALTQPYAVATVTVPKTARVGEFGRRLDSSVRRAGFAPLRLDLAQDVAFASSTIPLGVSLARGAQ